MAGRSRGLTVRWLAGGVIAAGFLAVATALLTLETRFDDLPAWVLPVLVGLVAVASGAVVRIRLRSTVVGTAWTDAAVLVCVVCLPPGWVPISVGAGVLTAKLFGRVTPFKSVYNAAKDALASTAGLLMALHLGVAHVLDPLAHPAALAVVALTVAAAEAAIGAPVLALATGTPWYRVHRADGDIKLFFFAGKLIIAVLALVLWQTDPRLLAVIPPVALCLHLLYASRVRARADRIAWQRLAAATEELNDTDLDTVLRSAVLNAVQLFSADQAEVFLRDGPDGPVLVRGDADGVLWSGDPGQAPVRQGDVESVTARLAGPDLKADLGEVRLHYEVRVDLTDRERLTLRTFASALRTAVRNASAFAEARRLAMRNAHAALHDPLTGLANRRRLQEYGEAALAGSGLTGLAVIDLDLFREVNETLGYLAGDRLLVEVARRLTRPVAPNDLVARLDGDEFAILLAGVGSAAAAEQRVREVLAALDAPIDLSGMRVRVEASAGLAVADPAGPDEESAPDSAVVELLRRADVAMHQAKRGGPRVVRYEVARDNADAASLMLGGDLPRAIAEQEFMVKFQPIVDLATGQMVAAEALTRWQHPDRGYLNPRRFLAAVERSGLLPMFADVVLDQALDAVQRWRAIGIDAPVAVNASPRSLLDPTFARKVIDRLAARRIPGRFLMIELTETLTLSQVDLVGGVLKELTDAGIRLALDDFGTRSSSLAMLAKVPFHELKIDISFVSAMGTSPEALAVVRSTVELGRALERYVVAEGVERPDQRKALWELGCPAGQGHLFARAMSIDALMEAVSTGLDGTPGRLAAPMHAGAPNVIDLPRMRAPERDTEPEDEADLL